MKYTKDTVYFYVKPEVGPLRLITATNDPVTADRMEAALTEVARTHKQGANASKVSKVSKAGGLV